MIELILVIALGGLLVWAVTTLIPMPAQFRTAILVVAIVCLVIYVLQYFGVIGDQWWHVHQHRWRS